MGAILEDVGARQFPACPEDVQTLFEGESFSTGLDLSPVRKPYIAWLNVALAKLDPKFAELGGDLDAYRQHIISSCAYRAKDCQNVDSTVSVTATVDRYGGRGLAGNGGSGRAAYLNGYYVKGVGKTALLGHGEEVSHASGDAYLEETVREAIFGEILAAELPHSAVRALAIICVGEEVHWEAVNKRENLVLIVRPAFLRIGHFARALCFRSKPEKNGALDAQRVAHLFRIAGEQQGSIGIFEWFETLHFRIAEQLAYCFAHRITQGSPTLSNWTVDGRLLDFGASTALPSYARAVLTPIGAGVKYLQSLEGVFNELEHVGTYAEDALAGFESYRKDFRPIAHRTMIRYKEVVAREFMRIVGTKDAELKGMSPNDREAMERCVEAVLLNEQKQRVDLIKNPTGAGASRGAVDALNSFRRSFPRSMEMLLEKYVCGGLREKFTPSGGPLLRHDRNQLFRESAKVELYRLVDPLASGSKLSTKPKVSEASVTRTISSWVASNRRDTRVVLNGFRHVGFAVSSARVLALFSTPACAHVYGVDEMDYSLSSETVRHRAIEEWLTIDSELHVAIATA